MDYVIIAIFASLFLSAGFLMGMLYQWFRYRPVRRALQRYREREQARHWLRQPFHE
jgi:hypothetical protein